jgi:two-component system, response regulator / RNA-binding antiterminator
VEVAVARFGEYQRLREELAEANLKLEERKLVERAKGLLMKARKLSEEEAYGALRRMAMERSVSIAEVARRVLEISDLLA